MPSMRARPKLETRKVYQKPPLKQIFQRQESVTYLQTKEKVMPKKE